MAGEKQDEQGNSFIKEHSADLKRSALTIPPSMAVCKGVTHLKIKNGNDGPELKRSIGDCFKKKFGNVSWRKSGFVVIQSELVEPKSEQGCRRS